MKGYNTIEELSLQQSYEILQNEESSPYIEQIRLHYEQELEKWHADEKRDFYACKSMREYEQFIEQYQTYSSFYTMQYKKAALDKIETLFWNANNSSINKCTVYLEKYPRGKYANEARKKIESLKRKRRITITVVLVILALICIIAYKPAGDISVSSESVSFSKYGETKNISVTTKANENNIDVSTTASWLKNSISGYSLQITAEENPNDDRLATIKITAYSTFFGERMSSVTKTISIYQESGLPTYLRVTKNSLSFDKYGSAKNGSFFIIKTDGIGYLISCPDNFVHINSSFRSSKNAPREIEVTISLDKNESEFRSSVITITTGTYTEVVNISQDSGAAKFLTINGHYINADKDGNKNNSYYRIQIETDGTSWEATTSYNWITLEQYNKTLDIRIARNNDNVRTGYVYVNSNNGHCETINIKQDGNPSEFYASRSSLSFDTSSDYKYLQITNNSGQKVTCSTNKKWLSATILGSDIKISCTGNSMYNSPRDGIVTLYCGDKTYEIEVHQKGYVECTHCHDGKMKCDNNVGWVWEYEYDAWWRAISQKLVHGTSGFQSMPPYYWSRRCTKCNGTGKIDCKYCNGTGKMKSY